MISYVLTVILVCLSISALIVHWICRGEPGYEQNLASIRVVIEVLRERRRQQETEGWTPAHDDQHYGFELSAAATCYAGNVSDSFTIQDYVIHEGLIEDVPKAWPWEPKYWKPKDPRRDLIRAAALIVAEIERLDRARTTR